MRDVLEITRVLQLYFAALDDRDYARLDEVFSAGAEVRYSLDAAAGPALGWRQMLERIEAFNAQFLFTQHLSAPALIEVTGAAARARTNLRALHVQEHPDGRRSAWIVHGIYRDVLVRTAGGWRIRERDFRTLHTEGEPPAAAGSRA